MPPDYQLWQARRSCGGVGRWEEMIRLNSLRVRRCPVGLSALSWSDTGHSPRKLSHPGQGGLAVARRVRRTLLP
jgi:hypothetical protein